jgi:microcystin-dependent protein
MASTFSDRLKLELQASGENAGTWGDKTNNNLEVIDAFVNGYLSKSVAGSSDVTLTTADASATAESSNKVIELTGALTGNIKVLVPAKESNYVIFNNTTGSFTLTVAPTGHTSNGVAITQGSHTMIYNQSDKCVDVLGAKVGTTGTTYIGSGAELTGIDIIPAGSLMLFQQSSAPTGWTKGTAHDNKALRVVTGSASSGGSNTFAAAFNNNQTVSGTTSSTSVTITGSTAAHTLTISEMPAHTHTEGGTQEFGTTSSTSTGVRNTGNSSPGNQFETQSTGGGGSHSHDVGTLAGGSHTHTFSDTFNLDVQYVDLIICSKDS